MQAGKLDGRVALVTGAGRGIGAAIARKLASEGASVLVCDLDADPAEATAKGIAASGGHAETLVGDVNAPDFGERAIEKVIGALGGVDIIVNNAGYVWNTTIQKTSDEQWQAMLDVHATAPFRILRAAAPFLRESARREQAEGKTRHRKVVNISSTSGVFGAATQLAYSAAKASMIGVTRTLAQEWGRYRVNVNCVAFGWIETRLTAPYAGEPNSIDVAGRSYKVGLDQTGLDAARARIPLGRAGTPDEAAGAVYLFCCPESDYISGEILVCGGGVRG